ncbi:MAG TPA: type II and III secretion system protein family protein [Sphingomonas sp.]|jgi:pilus assembly protein CpaC|uniref:type II and III secretion system protein family protein n=1 Tax=Sphingomonas sp. TaxID=28214 RepID=UPI002EDA926A
MRTASITARSLATIMAAAILAGAAPGGASSAGAQGPAASMTAGATVVQVGTGRGRLITLARPMSDLFVADDGIADVQVRSPTQLYVFGKKPGETTVSATAKGGAVLFQANVRVGNNFDSLGGMLALAMPEAKIVATPMNGLVLLTGTVAAPEDAAEAERLVQAFVGDSTKVLSRLKTATPLQVNLQVRIAEVSRSFVKNIGMNLQSRDSTGGFKFGIAQGRGAGTQFIPGGALSTGFTSPSASGVTKAGIGTTLGLAGNLLGLDLLSAIDLGETIGQVSTLANPNLTALSGETATFLAGGEIPIPLSQGLGAVSVEFKQYGISLAYTPTVLSDGRISLRVRPEVSQITSEGAVQINGTTIPALSTRRAETTLELGSGQSMMIAGLLQNSHNNSVDKTPGLGNLPVLGALFRSTSFRRNETELVIIITPYLVKPVNNAADIALPTDGYKSASDLQQALLGRIDGGQGGHRPVPTVAGAADASPAIGVAAPVAPSPLVGRRPTPSRSRPDKRAVAPGFSN